MNALTKKTVKLSFQDVELSVTAEKALNVYLAEDSLVFIRDAGWTPGVGNRWEVCTIPVSPETREYVKGLLEKGLVAEILWTRDDSGHMVFDVRGTEGGNWTEGGWRLSDDLVDVLPKEVEGLTAAGYTRALKYTLLANAKEIYKID